MQTLNHLSQGFESGEVDKVHFEKGANCFLNQETANYIYTFYSGLLDLEPVLRSCIVCLQQESEKTHKRMLSQRAEIMMANSREMIMFLEFL